MKKWNSWFWVCAVTLGCVTLTSCAQQQTTQPTPPVNVALLAPPPSIAAKSYMLIDVGSGQVFAQHNIDMPVEPASLTKLMTAYLVFDALHHNSLTLDQTLTVSARARNMPGSRMFVEQNSKVRVEDLIKGMIVQSGNDATIVLAEGVGGSVENFVSMMNQQARMLGMTNTTFHNPEGLNAAGHLTTARDLGILATRLITDFPQAYSYYSIKEFTYSDIRQANRNKLLFLDPSVDGLQTGHTDAAGYCLVASGVRNFPNLHGKRRLLSIVLGAHSDAIRTQESQKLLNWGFQMLGDVKYLTQP